MDDSVNSSSSCYDCQTVVAVLAISNAKRNARRERVNNKPKQEQQKSSTTNTTAATTVGNFSPKLASTFQGMSVTMQQSASSGMHTWPTVRQDRQTNSITTAAVVKQHSNNNNNNNNGKLQKPAPLPPPPMIMENRTKARNKSEEAISDLLQRIPDIGHIFNVHCRIGNGTFSTVLLATLKRESQLPESMRRKFAIKHHIPTSHPDRIMKELQCMTDMGGTNNVVGIHCCLRCDASAAFVMPYMAHDRFHDFYTKMEVPEIRNYMRNLLVALRHVHKFNIIHRDVKPSNFLYNRRQGQFLLVDFGLAQHVNPVLLTAQREQHSKRPRMHDTGAGGESSAAAVPAQQQAIDAGMLRGAVKRMRLIEDNKMPLKPVNEITQSGRAQELPTDGSKTVEASTATVSAPVPVPISRTVPSTATETMTAAASSSTRYNTNRSTAGKCYCFANPSVCISCLMKKEVHASRAGTPGYRPPEVLLKYADQTTAVDIWAAGVMFLSILSSVYPFFKAPNDFVALAEMVTIFGDHAIRKTALALERMVTLSQSSMPLDLRKLCLRFRHRLIFSDAQMIRKHETPDGRCPVCKNCDQYFFNCLCQESTYFTEPLEPYECFPASAYDLLRRLLEVNPHQRITAEEALQHPFFTEQLDAAATAPAAPTLKQATRRRNNKQAEDGGPASGVGAGASTVVPESNATVNKL